MINGRIVQSVGMGLMGMAAFVAGMAHGADTGDFSLTFATPFLFFLAAGYEHMRTMEWGWHQVRA